MLKKNEFLNNRNIIRRFKGGGSSEDNTNKFKSRRSGGLTIYTGKNNVQYWHNSFGDTYSEYNTPNAESATLTGVRYDVPNWETGTMGNDSTFVSVDKHVKDPRATYYRLQNKGGFPLKLLPKPYPIPWYIKLLKPFLL